MKGLTRRGFVKVSSMAGAALAGAAAGKGGGQATGFQAASNTGGPGGQANRVKKGPGIQSVFALCEITGGGKKVFGVAVQYDVAINPASLALDTYTTSVVAAARGGGMMGGPGGAPGGGGPAGGGPAGGGGAMMMGGPGMMDGPGMMGGPGGPQNAGTPGPKVRPVVAIYTNSEPALLRDHKSVPGMYVITEFAHNPDLSSTSTDSDKVTLTQDKDVKTTEGTVYPGSATVLDNAGGRGNNVAIRSLDKWEQSHWWWDDSRSAMLEYSIYLPQSFLKEGGENKEYPLVIAITHSGTSYTGTTTETLTDGVIASMWGMPEEQAQHECVVITPRYERTTMNDYWEHSYDVENTYKLVESFLKNTWNYGNPNLEDRRDKVLKIDSKRVYTTGWSMGAMTSIWMMAKHPNTFAAGLIIAGQQRPSDVVTLAKQNVLIITGTEDGKATPWNEKCVPVWEHAGGKVTRPAERLDAALIFPVDDQKQLSEQINGYLGKGGNITYITFANVDHMGSARKFFYIKAAKEWLFKQKKA